jgi:hypothetical protein
VSTLLVAPASWLPATNIDLAEASSDEYLITIEDAKQSRALLLKALQLLPCFWRLFFAEATYALFPPVMLIISPPIPLWKSISRHPSGHLIADS